MGVWKEEYTELNSCIFLCAQKKGKKQNWSLNLVAKESFQEMDWFGDGSLFSLAENLTLF